MLKTLGRTLIILIAAGLISLGWYAYATTAADSSMIHDGPGQMAPEGEDGEAGEMGQKQRPPEGESGSSLVQLLSGIAPLLAKTTLAIVVVSLIRMLVKRLKPMLARKEMRTRLGPAPSQTS